MNDFIKSSVDWFKEKTNSSLYFTYFVFVVVWNWKTFFTLFFEDASLFEAPRVEYVLTNFGVHFYATEEIILYRVLEFFTNIIWHAGVPILLTFWAVKYLPRFNAWAHEIEVENYYKRKRVYDAKKITYEEEKTFFLKTEAEEKIKQKTAKDSIQKSQTQEEKWESEFLRIDEEDVRAIQVGVSTIYGKSGHFTTDPLKMAAISQYGKYISHDLYARLDSMNLIKKDNNNSSKIEFTEKGKYFVRKLQEQKRV
ncbi:MAG: hypothetical protein WC724_00685 [Candidatus Paceibacterota bacterium]|jgi:hypothetical protein